MKMIQNECSQDHGARKKLYERPAVTTFGSVAKLTLGQNGSHADNGHNANTRKG